jgi:AhpC/TSA family
MKHIITFLILLSCVQLHSQLQNGSVAPDFMLTDIDGNSHHLYDYLDEGKTVYIDCFAAHCPSCWAYHNQHQLEMLDDAYGPNGTINQDIVIIAVEQDPGNGLNELQGVSGYTQGNWLEGTNYAVINPEGQERTDFIENYAVNYYPLIYAICPDRTVHQTGTVAVEELIAFSAECSMTSVPSSTEKNMSSAYFDSDHGVLIMRYPERVSAFRLLDSTGKTIQQVAWNASYNRFYLNSTGAGIYLCVIENRDGTIETIRVVVS